MKLKLILGSINQWIDSHFSESNEVVAVKDENNIKMVAEYYIQSTVFILYNIACLAVFWVGYSTIAIVTALFVYYVRMFAITGFYHRYFSHRTFKTNRFWQFFFGVIGASAVQQGPLWWASHHRHHHRYSDQIEDLHSPRRDGFYQSHMGWIFDPKNFETNYELITDFSKYPELRFLNRNHGLVSLLLAFSLFFFGNFLQTHYPQLHTNGWQILVWGFFISTFALFHATCTINSLSHQFGKRPYNTTDDSRNNFWLALLTLGEGWHNNHHYYPSSIRHGFHWWQIDITFYLLWLLSKLHIIYDLRMPSKEVIESGELDKDR